MMASRDVLPLLIAGIVGFIAVSALRKQTTPASVPGGASLWMMPEDNISTPVMPNMTRGERNNNPGNIRKGPSQWQGMLPASEQTDPAFVRFATPEDGIRALAVLLKNYSKQGFQTIATIIGKYAPSTENDTFAYAKAVGQSMGIPTNQVLNLNDPATLQSLVTAIIKHENGRVSYNVAQIGTGVSRA